MYACGDGNNNNNSTATCRQQAATWHAALMRVRPPLYEASAICAEHGLYSNAASVCGLPVVAVNVKDETHLSEWIAHHLLSGFGHAIIWDDASAMPLAPLRRLPALLSERATLASRCSDRARQPKYLIQQDMVNAAALMGASWAMALDADEFLVVPGRTVGGWLATLPATVEQVACNWLMFGTSFHEDLGAGDLLLASYTHHLAEIDQHVKCLQRTSNRWSGVPRAKWTSNQPHFMTYSGREATSVLPDGQRWEANPFNRGGERDPRRVRAFVAHFAVQARLECVRRKLIRPTDDTFQMRVELRRNDSLARWDLICNHDAFNDVDDGLLLQYAAHVAAVLRPESGG